MQQDSGERKSRLGSVGPVARIRWLVALLLATACSWMASRNGLEAGSSLLIGFLVLGLSGLAIEMASAVWLLRGNRGARRRSQLPPADGRIEVVRIPGYSSKPSAIDARFRYFEPTSEDRSAPRNVGRGYGELADLVGRVTVFSLFVGRDGTNWSDREMIDTLRSVETAAAWIEGQAIRWNAPVDIGVADLIFVGEDHSQEPIDISVVDEGNGTGLFEAEAPKRALILASRIALDLGFKDLSDLVERVSPEPEPDLRIWLMHQRRAGRSIAIPPHESELDGIGLAVCYPRYADFPQPLQGTPASDSATIAHELLHLVGASDKYGVPLRSYPPGQVTDRDIMRLSYPRLRQMRVDYRTAREIGWQPEQGP